METLFFFFFFFNIITLPQGYFVKEEKFPLDKYKKKVSSNAVDDEGGKSKSQVFSKTQRFETYCDKNMNE